MRAKLGLTQHELAQSVGIDHTSVSHWESGISCPDFKHLPDLANALGVSHESLLEDVLSWKSAA